MLRPVTNLGCHCKADTGTHMDAWQVALAVAADLEDQYKIANAQSV